jgi:hypothetical protein
MAEPVELTRSLELDPAVETVEMKITARAVDEDLVLSVLEREGAEPESREVYFFDTQGLALFEAGIVLRARLVRDGADDSTVKLRPVVPDEIADEWKRTSGFEIEIDAVGDELVCSAKLSVEQERGEIAEVAAGERQPRKLFADEQERLLEEHGPVGIGWDDLSVLGPVDVREWEIEPNGLGHEVTVEEWVLPDGSDLVELSIKVEPGKAAEASREFAEYLRSRAIDTEGDQQTKTRTALSYFTTGGP